MSTNIITIRNADLCSEVFRVPFDGLTVEDYDRMRDKCEQLEEDFKDDDDRREDERDELLDEVENLKNEIDGLEKENDKLKDQIDELKEEIKELTNA